MRYSELKRRARLSLNKRWGYAVLVTLIYAVVNMIPNSIESMLGGGVQAAANGTEPASAQIISLLVSFLLLPLSMGISWYFLEVSRGRQAKWTTLFDPFDISIYLKMLGVSFLIVLYTVLWSLLFLIPGIIKGYAYSQTFFILKDNPELTPNQAITKSRKLMKGYKWTYFVFILSFIGWILLCILSFGIGLLWFLPYYYTSTAWFYNELRSKQESLDEVSTKTPI